MVIGVIDCASLIGPPMDRSKQCSEFLSKYKWNGATSKALAADASFRRYYRLALPGKCAVLMDAPPAHEDVRPFVAVAHHLSNLGLSAPNIFGLDVTHGFLLMEDLGDNKFNKVLSAAENVEPFYERAIDVLCALHEVAPPSWLAPYDVTLLLAEADLFIDWYWPSVTGNAITKSRRAAYREAWIEALSKIELDPVVTVLRDYHADNLMWLPNRHGTAAVGLLDFQDALAGSAAYDIVSLLEDARRDVSINLSEKMIRRYVNASRIDASSFRSAYSVLGAQRNSKIIGIFTRLWKRDGKAPYLALIPRVWRYLERNLEQPVLAPVQDWFDQYLPEYLRREPQAS